MKRVITDVTEEYEALRHATGLVNYEGIGRYTVAGAGAATFLDHVATRTVDFLLEGQITNALLLRPDGTIVAETLVHCLGEEYLVEVWPAQAREAGEHLMAAAASRDDVTVVDAGVTHRVLGIEGPESFRIADKLLPFSVASMAYSSAATAAFNGSDVLISRTGVTAEYGFKFHVPAEHADELWKEFENAGAQEVGLDALDICRMESRFVNLERESGAVPVLPTEVGLQWMVDLNGEFVGVDALREAGTVSERRPVCWQADTGTEAAQVWPAGTPVAVADQTVGEISHAVWSPSLNRVIGVAHVDAEVAASGQEFTVEDRPIQTVSAPFLVATSFRVTME